MAYCIPIVAAVEEAIADPDRGGMHPLLYATKNPKCPNPYWSPETDDELLAQTVSVLERRNIIGVLSGPPELVLHWQGESPNRFIPALAFLEGGVDFSNDLSPEQVRELIESEGFAVFGEVESQYGGISPIDERMSPYWALAEELDIPVEIYMGEGPPSVSTLIPTYRARLTSPYQLENVLTKHPNLRVYVMHYASPLIEEMIAMLGAYPQLYLDIGGMQSFYPREYVYQKLKQFVDAGFEKRIMFGSDNVNWPGIIEPSIEIVADAPFLNRDQVRNILYYNAARFLRLTDEQISKYHQM
jgi:predicted TIM-barrel fold metal-dependent hydrolase